jgi:hypothetical protein
MNIRKLELSDLPEVLDIIRSRDSIQLRKIDQYSLEFTLRKVATQIGQGKWLFVGAFENDKMIAWRSFYRWPNFEDVTLLDIYTRAGAKLERTESGRPIVVFQMMQFAIDYLHTRHLHRIWAPRTTDERWKPLDCSEEGVFLSNPKRFLFEPDVALVKGTTHEIVDIKTGESIPELAQAKDYILGLGSTNPHDQYMNLIHDLDAIPWPPVGEKPPTDVSAPPVPDPTKTVIEFPQ